MKQHSHRKQIIEGIRDILIPYFLNLGFSIEPSRHVTILGESKNLYPLGCLTRFSEDGTMDVIEFKFGKYKNAGFEINFAQILSKGAHHDFGFSPQSDVSAYGFGDFGIYQKSRFLSFRNFCTYILKFNAFHNVKRDILKARKSAFEIEDWFQSRKVGMRLRTQENIGRGIKIYRGWPSFFILRKVDVSYINLRESTNKIKSIQQAKSIVIQTLEKQNRTQKFGFYWPWQKIMH